MQFIQVRCNIFAGLLTLKSSQRQPRVMCNSTIWFRTYIVGVESTKEPRQVVRYRDKE